jgi:large subunit ribosomal protein L7/L12
MNTRLEQLLKKKEELNAQIQKIRAAEANEKRKEDTRRKILLGALMMEMMERGELDRDVVRQRLDGFLSRSGDRSLFGLAVDGKSDGEVKDDLAATGDEGLSGSDGGGDEQPSSLSELEDLRAFEVVLLEVPSDQKIAVLKVVRILTNLGLKEAKDLVESAPRVVVNVNGQEKALEFKRQLEEAGAKVSVRKAKA